MNMGSKSRRLPEIKPEERSWPAVIPISGINPESRPEKLREGKDTGS